MAEKIKTENFVKRLMDMNNEELNALPKVKATLRRDDNKRFGQVNHRLLVSVAKDFNFEIRLTEEQYALIKLERDIENDNQSVYCYTRISVGTNTDGSTYHLFELVASASVRFNHILSAFRVRQIELMQKKGAWPIELTIKPYQAKGNIHQELQLTDLDAK